MKKPSKQIAAYNKAKAVLLKREQDLTDAVAPEYLRCLEVTDREGMIELISVLPKDIKLTRRCYEALIIIEDREEAARYKSPEYRHFNYNIDDHNNGTFTATVVLKDEGGEETNIDADTEEAAVAAIKAVIDDFIKEHPDVDKPI